MDADKTSPEAGGSFEWKLETHFGVDRRIALPPKEDGSQYYDSIHLLERMTEGEILLSFGSVVDDDDFDPPERIKLEIRAYHLKNPETNEVYHVDVQTFLSHDTAHHLWLALNTILNWKGL